MFEKEAEEYRNCNTNYYEWDDFCADDGEPIEEAYQKGAEFGYNKANEWHYVKDGKYPKENQLVMVYRVNPLGANIAITNWYDSYKDTKVIAWKEIVLPEIKESE